MDVQYYSPSYDEYRYAGGLGRRNAIQYKLFYKLVGGDEVLAHQLFFRQRDFSITKIGNWNESYLNYSTWGQDLASLTLLEQSVLGSGRWKHYDTRIFLYNKLDLIRERSMSPFDCVRLPCITTDNSTSEIALVPLGTSYFNNGCLSRVVPELESGGPCHLNEEAEVLQTRNVVQFTCVGQQSSAISISYLMVLIAKVANYHLTLLREQTSGRCFVFNAHGTESLLRLPRRSSVESDDDYDYDHSYDPDPPEEPRYNCSVCVEETKSTEDASDDDLTAPDEDLTAPSTGLSVGTVPLGCSTWLKGYDPTAECKVDVSNIKKKKTASASWEKRSSCAVTLHDVHQGRFHVRYLASVEEMAKSFRRQRSKRLEVHEVSDHERLSGAPDGKELDLEDDTTFALEWSRRSSRLARGSAVTARIHMLRQALVYPPWHRT